MTHSRHFFGDLVGHKELVLFGGVKTGHRHRCHLVLGTLFAGGLYHTNSTERCFGGKVIGVVGCQLTGGRATNFFIHFCANLCILGALLRIRGCTLTVGALVVAHTVPQVLGSHTQKVEQGCRQEEEAENERAGKATKAIQKITERAANKSTACHFGTVAHQSLCGKIALIYGEHRQAEYVNDGCKRNDKDNGCNDFGSSNLVIDISFPINSQNHKERRECKYGRAKGAKQAVADVISYRAHPMSGGVLKAVLPVAKDVE